MINYSWKEIKDFYQSKKVNFANKLSYYGNKDEKWGEIYGYNLKSPYNIKEIEEYEKQNSFKLSNDLRYYLLNISK